jgi:hypothetical protein
MVDQFLVFIQPGIIIFESATQMAEMLAVVSLAFELFHDYSPVRNRFSPKLSLEGNPYKMMSIKNHSYCYL